MTAEHLARRLADAAAQTAARRSGPRSDPPPPPAPPSAASPVALAAVDVPTGWVAYDRAIWPLGDDITDDRVLVEGTDRRAHAALNHYLRQGEPRPAAGRRSRRLPRQVPALSTAQVSFHRDGEDICVVHEREERAPLSRAIAVLVADR